MMIYHHEASYPIVARMVNILTGVVTTFLRSVKLINAHLSPAALRERVADWLRRLGNELIRLSNRLSPQKKGHRGEAPLLGLSGYTTPTELSQLVGRTQAAILQKILEWQEHNRRENQTKHDGHYWTYNSYQRLRDEHFKDLHEDTVRKAIRALEKAGLLISFQPGPSEKKWYRVDEKAISKAIQKMGKPSARVGKTPSVSGSKTPQGGQNAPLITTGNPQSGDSQIQSPTQKQQQQPLQDEPDVVVAPPALPHREPEAESGEHCLEGEGRDTTAVKAFVPHEQHHNDQPFPKVPLKGFSVLATDLVKFKVLAVTAQRLVDQYPEADVRYVLEYARGESSLRNPPGFVVDELDTRKHGVLAARDLQKDLQTAPSPTRFIPPDDFVCTDEEREEIGLIGFERFMARRRENERAVTEQDSHLEYA